MSAMCLSLPDSRYARGRRGGFALPSAIFLMLILAGLGVFIVRVNVMQTSSTALDVLGANAYQAAVAGTEWGAYQALRVAGPAPAACFADTTITFAGTSLAPFTTTVKCVRTSTNELGVTVTVDQITATACNQTPCPNLTPTINNYVARQVTVTLAQP